MGPMMARTNPSMSTVWRTIPESAPITQDAVDGLKAYSDGVADKYKKAKAKLLLEIKGYHKMCNDHKMQPAEVKRAMKDFKKDLGGSIVGARDGWATDRATWHPEQGNYKASELTKINKASKPDIVSYPEINELFVALDGNDNDKVTEIVNRAQTELRR